MPYRSCPSRPWILDSAKWVCSAQTVLPRNCGRSGTGRRRCNAGEWTERSLSGPDRGRSSSWTRSLDPIENKGIPRPYERQGFRPSRHTDIFVQQCGIGLIECPVGHHRGHDGPDATSA